MKNKLFKIIIIMCTILSAQVLEGCLFDYVKQPKSAQPGEIINIELSITSTIVPETNIHKGLVGIAAPDDWTFISADYTSNLGNGIFSESSAWQDSVEKYFPNANYGNNMKWFVFISDTGYTYNDPTTFIVHLKMQVGQTEGCFNIGYLTTKATSGLLSSGNPQWAPVSFPHPIGVPDSNLCTSIFETRPAPEWDEILDRKSGWTGSDGIYSIPLNGSEQPSTDVNDKHLILFSDTFIGDVDSNNHRVNAKLINNTLAFIPNTTPNSDSIKFFWRQDSSGNPLSVYVPQTPNAHSGDWYWLMDGISIDDTIYVFAIRLNANGSGAFGFEINGAVLLKFNFDEQNFISNVKQFDTPFYYKSINEDTTILLGQAIMPMTTVSGNPSPDGYIYIYGPKTTGSGKNLVAARFLPQDIEHFDKWNFWNGNDWSNKIEDCKSITSGISQEFSVTPLNSNKFLLVVQSGNTVAVKLGESPVGPFGVFHTIYNCPEVIQDPNIFVYNAKAHPSLSTKDELLISYNVNSFDFSSLINNADIYRPRFIYLKINDTTTTKVLEMENVVDAFKLEQNYPNPFNPSTTINFSLKQNSNVSLIVYDILGNKISEIVKDKLNAGFHSYTFNVNNLKGKSLASGIYFYTLQADNFIITKKMVYLK